MFPKKIKLSPSIIATDLSNLGETIKNFDGNLIDLIHVDVMDGFFVPNLTIGPGYIKDLKKQSHIPLDVHLMIEKPEKSIDQYLALKPKYLTLHYESTNFLVRTANLIRQENISPGLAINMQTPLEAIYDLLPLFDLILIMSVDPGFYGQPFIKESLGKIERLSSFLKKEKMDHILIEVDGGLDDKNVSEVIKAGADIIVSGNYLFRENNINIQAEKLLK